MTKEQEAIERLENLVKLRKNKGGKIKYDNCICGTEDLETVLDMLKEKDAEIEKKEKQIDLMADFMYKAGTGRRVLSCMFRQNDECNENGCRYCIKQYFENKAKE